MIRHTVSFRLSHDEGSDTAQDLFVGAVALAKIPGVKNFELLRQVSEKSDFGYALSMEFVDAAAFELYNNHPDHLHFVTDLWLPEVADAQELDYETFEPAG
jgi:Stress responsive A/B Barrel Domain